MCLFAFWCRALDLSPPLDLLRGAALAPSLGRRRRLLGCAVRNGDVIRRDRLPSLVEDVVSKYANFLVCSPQPVQRASR